METGGKVSCLIIKRVVKVVKLTQGSGLPDHFSTRSDFHYLNLSHSDLPLIAAVPSEIGSEVGDESEKRIAEFGVLS